MEKGSVPSTESAPPYPGLPMAYPGPSHPSAPVLSPTGPGVHVAAPPYPGPPTSYPSGPQVHVGQPRGRYFPPMAPQDGPYAVQPRLVGAMESAPPYPGPPMHHYPGGPQPAMYHPPQGVPQGGPGYAPVPSTTVVVQAPAPVYTTTVVASVLQDVPGQTMCPYCQQSVVTQTNHTSGLMAWLICCGLCLVGCGLCSFIPFCLDSCQDVEHRCPCCHKLIYIYKRMN